jgi:hypothetical protein
MAFLNPFANLGIRTPGIATPSIASPGIFAPFMNTTSGMPSSYYSVPANNKPLPPTVWGTTPPNAGLKTAGPVIPTNSAGQPDMSLLPQGWKPAAQTAFKPMTSAEINSLLKSISAPPPPAPVMQKLTAPAPVKTPVKTPVKAPVAPVVRAPAKTAVIAPKTK